MHTRHDWQAAEILDLLHQPLLDLVYQAHSVHRAHQPAGEVQLASLMSIKTGACPEDCKYCPQSAHYPTASPREPLLDVAVVLEAAAKAKAAGASRFCMGAAWRKIPEGNAKATQQFDAVLAMIKGVKALGIEACVTLGMVTPQQAEALAEAGLTAYNHNLDTSPEYYQDIITTRTYQDRLDTLDCISNAGIEVCSGGIIGMGESWMDRARLLEMLATRTPHPNSVPINTLVPVPGTPFANLPPVASFDLVRMCAAARITMPKAKVRLSAGRLNLSEEAQALCFMAGANSIFYGEKLLTTGNNDAEADQQLLARLGLKATTVAAEYALDAA